MKSIVLTLVLFVASGAAANAMQPVALTDHAAMQVDGLVVPVVHLGTVYSVPGETREHFLGRVGRALRAFSDATGFEACSEVYGDSAGNSAVYVITAESHVSCPIVAASLDGYRPQHVTIHSHGGEGSFSFNAADRALMQSAGGGARGAVRTRHLFGQDVRHFSERDFEGSAGYLATPDGLIYHAEGSQRVTDLVPYPVETTALLDASASSGDVEKAVAGTGG